MKSQTESLEHASVRQYCRAVRMPTVGANFVSLAEQAVKENHSHIRYLEALLATECEPSTLFLGASALALVLLRRGRLEARLRTMHR